MKSINKNIIKNYPGVVVIFEPVLGIIQDIDGAARATLFPALENKKQININELRGIILESDRPEVIETTVKNISESKSWTIEYPVSGLNNTRWLRERSFFTTDEKNGATIVGLFIDDITGLKTHQESLLAELNQASRAADRKNEFFASMSHEIRTPMNAVMGMAQILARTNLDVEQKQYVNTIIGSSNALVQIINDILDLSKLEAGKIEILKEEVDLENLCLEVCRLLSTRAYEKQLQVHLNFQATEVKNVLLDKGRLRQILINLIGNAIKFTDTGYVELLVEKIPNNEQSLLRFSIKDTGIGISDSAKSKLFKAYGQADKTITQRFGGTGLGLQISQRLVNLLGGEIDVESGEGVGSNFWFTLPLELGKNETPVMLQGKSCLLVTTDTICANIIENILHNNGLRVEVKSRAEESNTLFSKSSQFDYIIIDNTTDNIDGLKLAASLKQHNGQHDIPLVLLTSLEKRENSATLYDAGVNAYLPKPVSPSLLYKALSANETEDPASNKALYVSNECLEKNENTSLYVEGKALIAEDVEVNQVILNSMLTRMGLKTEIANNGKEALEKVANNDYDIIFMDCRMPVMDGFTATEEIRKLRNDKSDMPIVALTANAGESDKQACIAAGMSDFLSKPYAEKDLQGIVSKWLETEICETLPIIETGNEVFENDLLDHVQFDSIKDSLGEEFANFALDITDKFMNYQQDIIDAMKIGDMQKVLEKGHSLKGIAAMIGAKQIAEIAFSIEQAGKEEDLESAYEMAIVGLTKLDAAISKTHSMIIINLNPEIDKSMFLF